MSTSESYGMPAETLEETPQTDGILEIHQRRRVT
jgi:hypothetical protein